MGFTGLERSEEIQNKIDSARYESVGNQEKAKLLRMELMLDTSTLIRDTLKAVEEDPYTTVDELLARTKKTGKVLNPEAVSTFLGVTYYIKQLVNNVKTEEKNRRTKDFGKQLFMSMLLPEHRSSYKLAGDVAVYTDYPLAVRMVLSSPEDFQQMANSITAGGLYRSSQIFLLGNSVLHAPLIIERSSLDNGIAIHEKGHAEYRIVGEVFFYMRKNRNVNTKGLDLTADIKEEDAGNENLTQLTDYAIEKAKDEILSQMKVSDNSMPLFMATLGTKGGPYDYFANDLGIKEGDSYYDRAWGLHTQNLNNYTSKALTLNYFYRQRPEWNERKELFRWVLAQIPMQEWEKRLKDTLFIEEFKLARNLEFKFYVLEARLKPPAKLDDLSESEAKDLEMARKMKAELMKTIETGCDKPLVNVLRNFNKVVDEFILDMEQKPIHKVHKAYTEYESMLTGPRVRWGSNDGDGAATLDLISKLDNELNLYPGDREKQLEIINRFIGNKMNPEK